MVKFADVICAHITALPLGEGDRPITMVTGRVRVNQLVLPGTLSVKGLAS
ncbi:MAG: hypothetical protein ACJLS3_13595 [Erythrobacter sp.]